jgi:hypothetical protein
MTRLLPAILLEALVLVAAISPALTQQRAMEMDTDDMGNLKRSIDAVQPGKPEPGARGRRAEPTDARPSNAQKRARAKAARSAVHERQRRCGTEWRQARAAGKLKRGMTWPQYWSACNTRLKANAG